MTKKATTLIRVEKIYQNVKLIIEEVKNSAFRAVKFAIVKTYWHIGKLIVEEEQSGKQRADYGKGFNSSNLWYMRQFYNTFEKLHALRGELSWTHYRLLFCPVFLGIPHLI